MSRTRRHSRNPVWMITLVFCFLFELSGCSLFVMAGKMLQGDPVIEDDFKKWYGKSMAKSGKLVAVICSTPESVKSEFSSLDLDLASDISRKLARHDIKVIQSHKVASWMDDHGDGGTFDPKELGADLEPELVLMVKLDTFDFREENSPDLFRGKARGVVTVHELVREDDKNKGIGGFMQPKTKAGSKDEDDKKPAKSSEKPANTANDKSSGSKSDKGKKSDNGKSEKKSKVRIGEIRQVYVKTFDTSYPPHQPVSIEQMQPEVFRKKFLDRVGDELARLFYRHKPGTDI